MCFVVDVRGSGVDCVCVLFCCCCCCCLFVSGF